MDLGKVMIEGSGERASSVPPHEVPFRGGPVSGLSRTTDSTRFTSTPTTTTTTSTSSSSSSSSTTTAAAATHVERSRPPAAKPSSSSSDVWAGAISRLQTQVSYNTSMLESHRRQVADVEQAVGRLQGEMVNVVQVLTELRADLRARPLMEQSLQQQQQRHDSGDLDVLATQLSNVTSKANEVDGLRMQIELLKNRIKRFEERQSPRPMTGTQEMSDQALGPYSHPPLHHSHSSLPPMRPAAMMSPPDDPKHHPHAQPILPSQALPTLGTQHSTDSRASEPSSVQTGPPGFRPAEALPPPSSLSGWRPAADSRPPSGLPPPPPQYNPFRPHGMEAEPSAAGWAAVNASQQLKRPLEEPQHRSPYGPLSAPGSPKRPKLAPIMPRGNHGEDGLAPTPGSVMQQSASITPEGAPRSRSRAPSNVSQSNRPHEPALSAPSQTGAYRFITSQPDPHEHWRAGPEGELLMQHPLGEGRGRGRGRGGRGGRGRGRGRGGHHPPDHPAIPPHHHGEEHGPPNHLHGGHFSPLGHHNHTYPGRGGLVRRSGGPSDRAGSSEEHPSTPMHVGEEDYEGTSGGKKSRTRPIRNAEGILIRKDGRPDMRSVSSANNLRKVHAKKEAERAEVEGRTPTSSRSLAPAHSNSLSEEDGMRSGTPGSPAGEEAEEDQEAQERHQHLMSKIFPRGIDGAGGQGLASSYFPRSAPLKREEDVMVVAVQDGERDRGRDRETAEESHHVAVGQSQLRNGRDVEMVMAGLVPDKRVERVAVEADGEGTSQDTEMAHAAERVEEGVKASTEVPAAGQEAVMAA